MHTRKERQHRKRLIRRTIWRSVICLTGILILAGAWKVTSFAVHHLFFSGEKAEEAQEGQLTDGSAEGSDAQSAFASADNLLKGTASQDILLVNKDHPLSDTYRPNLVTLHNYGVEVDSSIFEALNQMLTAGEKEGLTFWIASAYRSTERQRELLDEDIEDLMRQGYSCSEAYEEAVRETMPVGCSEHATGLAVDIVAKDYQMLDEKQGRTAEMKWLQENCSQYGFILRYPEGKEDITKVDYESWHFRYVGVDAAKEIMEQGITLEEYLDPELSVS